MLAIIAVNNIITTNNATTVPIGAIVLLPEPDWDCILQE